MGLVVDAMMAAKLTDDPLLQLYFPEMGGGSGAVAPWRESFSRRGENVGIMGREAVYCMSRWIGRDSASALDNGVAIRAM
ncbi:hypothetical protein FZEAL_3716 [Fusarium zealandicum]|uniref:Uncharacterized protein n=1 Tax=Fusarium zealandicum TaxID=1053134 RepID=A0A8H4UNR9_9HYPO|nr:hypothetical protein FZEAL_3716 [Fusarium zealandicum]